MISFILSLSILLWNKEPKGFSQIDPCEIYGKVYIEPNPRYAHFKVYEDESEAFADIIIFEEENSLYADQVGHWSFVDDRDFADVYIYFEKDRSLADFSVYYTDYESFAGCNR
ncbi:MAG: DUF6150 family protein [Reichenbachiella sp.]|uniref:DUF6150 family protein n=1 Tax=Reichenbachiella sp. TaxID=2184521 RepID=UPI0032672617